MSDQVFLMKELKIKMKKKLKNSFRQKNEGVTLDDGNDVGRKLAYVTFVFLEGEWFLYLSSVLRNMSYK